MEPQFSCSVISDSLQPPGLQHTRLPCLSPTPGAYSNTSIKSVMPSNHLLSSPLDTYIFFHPPHVILTGRQCCEPLNQVTPWRLFEAEAQYVASGRPDSGLLQIESREISRSSIPDFITWLFKEHIHTHLSYLGPLAAETWFPRGFRASSVAHPELDCHSWPGTLRKEQVKFVMFVDSYFLGGKISSSYNIGVGGEKKSF